MSSVKKGNGDDMQDEMALYCKLMSETSKTKKSVNKHRKRLREAIVRAEQSGIGAVQTIKREGENA